MNFSPEEIRDLVCLAAAEKKAKNITIINVEHLTTLADYFVICTGMSAPQVKAIANNVDDVIAREGMEPIRREGIAEGRWAALDYGNVIVHIFHEETRAIYCLDKLWDDGSNITEYKETV